MSVLLKRMSSLHRALNRVIQMLYPAASLAPKKRRYNAKSAKLAQPVPFPPALEAWRTRELLSANMAIGMNLEGVRDYMAAWMFTDAFKESRPWIPVGLQYRHSLYDPGRRPPPPSEPGRPRLADPAQPCHQRPGTGPPANPSTRACSTG